MVWIPLPDPSDPDYFDKLYDIIPEARPALPEDYFVIDLTDESYGPLGRRLADAEDFDIPRLQLPPIDYSLFNIPPESSINEQLPLFEVPLLEYPVQVDELRNPYPFNLEPHDMMDLTNDSYTTIYQPEFMITEDELPQTLNFPRAPLNVPADWNFPLLHCREIDLTEEIMDPWINTQIQVEHNFMYIETS
jgi:hypothetical protein